MANEFHHANLRGANFRGKNLEAANFSHADIRGADFRDAVLVGANFRNTKAGLPIFWAIALIALSLILSLLAGLISAYAGAFISDLLSNKIYGNSFFGIISLITSIIFLIVIFWQGLGATLVTLAEVVAACLIAALAFFPEHEAGRNLAIGAVFTTLALAGVLAGVGNMAVAVAVAKIMTLPGAKILTGLMAFIGAVLGALLGVRSQESAFITAGLIGLVAIISGIYIGWQAINGEKKYSLIRALAIGIVAQKGTSFRGANLTDADFTQAILKSVDFREATLTRTCWFEAQKLEQARVAGTYLEHPKVQQLVITKDGREQNFNRLDLRDLNLKDANLQDASLICTDLSAATLQNANLSGAKLAQAQLYHANLTQANLTGAYIENWGISTDTQLNGVKCDYIYMQLPTKDDPDPCRKPDNRQETFKEGDFADFIAPIIKTLDLYHTQHIDLREVGKKFKTLDLFHYEGIDPSAAAIAIAQLAENHPEAELEVVALEGRGQEKIRLQAKVTGNANRSELYKEYFNTYSEIQSLPYSDLQTLLLGVKEKDERIRSLEKLLENAIHQSKFYVETSKTQTVKKILILSANPKGTSKLRLDEEVREIQAALKRARNREQFEIITEWAVRVDDLRRALLDCNPTIVHFSGHGLEGEGLALENNLGQMQLVSTESLARLFKLFQNTTECVLLNACYSEAQAKAIHQHIDYVIGMNQAIGDKAAIEFAVGFYDALGAGSSYEDCFEVGCTSIDLEKIPESSTPVIKARKRK